MTVLFADLVGFTSLSEHLDPEDVRAIQSAYFEHMSREIDRYGGTVEKYAGDAILAFFGVPRAHEDDAERGIRCALAMQAAVERVTASVRTQWDIELALRVGVNTGVVVSGTWDAGGRSEYSVSGDVVNTSARLQTAAKPGEVLAGEETMHLARREIRFGESRELILKGKSARIWGYPAIQVLERPAQSSRGRGQPTPFVGRDNELTLLTGIWAKVLHERRPHLVTILADPGIGKSRMAAEFEHRILDVALVLRGRCLPYGEVLGYWALATALKEAAGIVPEEDSATAYRKLQDLAANAIDETDADWGRDEMVRHLALLCGIELEDGGPVTVDQRTLHTSVRRFLEALARRQPLCLLLEDIHWANDTLLDLVEFIAARAHDVPLLILTEARPELIETRVSWGHGLRAFTSLPLEPLDEHSAQDLVHALCQERGLPQDEAERISQRAGGNPLFAEELAATIAERGAVAEMPSAIKALIASRLDLLPAEDRRVLQLAAVIGKVFWEGTLRILGAPEHLGDRLEGLEQRDLLRRQPLSRFRGDHEYAFKHDLIRDVAYETMTRAERRSLHGSVADWIEQVQGEREEYLDLLAYHAVRAEQVERAIGCLVRASERARRTAAHREEAALLAQAIGMAESTGQQELVTELRAKRSKALLTGAMWEEARAEYEIVLERFPSHRVEDRIQILVDLAVVRHWLLDVPGTHRDATEALSLAEQIGRNDLAALALTALALASSSDGDLRTSVEQYQRAYVWRGQQHVVLPSAGVELCGLVLYWLGEYDAAINLTRDAIESARAVYDTTTIARALGNLGMSLVGKGLYEEADQVFLEARRFARDHELRTWLARATAMHGGLHLELSDFDGAETLAEEAREISRSANWGHATISGGIDLLLNFARRGDLGRADILTEEVAEGVARGQGAHGWLWKLRFAQAQAEIALVRADHEHALRWAHDAIARARRLGRVKYEVTGLQARAQASAALGRGHEAIADLRSAAERARATDDPALFLRVAAALLVADGSDALLEEARAAQHRILGAMPSAEMIRHFRDAEAVRVIAGLPGG